MPNIRYLGHSSYYIGSSKGSAIITDPYGKSIPYTFPLISADVVLQSHEHGDHNAGWRVNGNPVILKRTNDFTAEFEVNVDRTKELLAFKAFPSYHDKFIGKKKGPNTIFMWYMDGMKFCHLGDLGTVLTEREIEWIGDVDVLFCPVGGGTVLTSSDAVLVVNQLKAKIVFPMHYKTKMTEYISWLEEPVENFVEKIGKNNTEYLYALATQVDSYSLPATTSVKILENG
ncbi:MAG: MBL fold metallo-hydrolase [bacterium]|nr:MBL fold metallo-hydrolase [bacterium]